MKRAVITTTIYRPDNLLDWAQHMRAGDIVVVSGDVKTPHNEVKDVLGTIADLTGVETAYVVETDTRTSRVVPMRSIQRRNVAVLEAIRMGADMITTVDTDNYPLADAVHNVGFGHLDAIENLLTCPYLSSVIGSRTGWVNVGEWCEPMVTHRGWPVEQRSHYFQHSHAGDHELHVGVHASLWLGDPDISAAERLLWNPEIAVVPEYSIVVEPGVWCPFNSQATTYRRELLPLLNVWPGVGRMDDIWPSYVARHIMDQLNFAVAYGAPNVRQERHEHDVVTDLENEIIGYRYTDLLLRELRQVNLSGVNDALTCLATVFDWLERRLRHSGIMPDLTYDFWRAWIADLHEIRGDQD